jgi:hypothetical protein
MFVRLILLCAYLVPAVALPAGLSLSAQTQPAQPRIGSPARPATPLVEDRAGQARKGARKADRRADEKKADLKKADRRKSDARKDAARQDQTKSDRRKAMKDRK